MAWWRRDRSDSPELVAAREDLATARQATVEYEPISQEMERLAATLRRSLRPPARPRGARWPNGGAR